MLSIDIGVGGRYHADRLADSLSQGNNVHLWTSLPVSRFPNLPSPQVHSIIWPEIVYRTAKSIGLENRGDLFKIHAFSKALARRLSQKGSRDVFLGWSSFSLETLRLNRYQHTALFRDSCHIRTQIELLDAEYEKNGVRFPNRRWVIDREEEEYERAESIFVLSHLARQSFLDRGIAPHKVKVIRLGADTSRFTLVQRNEPNLPLKVVYFGALSIRKGFHYLLDAVRILGSKQVQLTAIGTFEEGFPMKRRAHFRHVPALPQAQLAERLGEFDVFVMPTLEDGFGQTLCQAMAAGLVPIATSACGAAEQIKNGENGIVIHPGSAEAIAEALYALCKTPSRITQIRKNISASRQALGWEQYQETLRAWAVSLNDRGGLS